MIPGAVHDPLCCAVLHMAITTDKHPRQSQRPFDRQGTYSLRRLDINDQLPDHCRRTRVLGSCHNPRSAICARPVSR